MQTTDYTSLDRFGPARDPTFPPPLLHPGGPLQRIPDHRSCRPSRARFVLVQMPLGTVYIYDADSDTWRQGPAFPSERRRGGAGTVTHEGKIYVVCGIVDGHTSGTIA